MSQEIREKGDKAPPELFFERKPSLTDSAGGSEKRTRALRRAANAKRARQGRGKPAPVDARKKDPSASFNRDPPPD